MTRYVAGNRILWLILFAFITFSIGFFGLGPWVIREISDMTKLSTAVMVLILWVPQTIDAIRREPNSASTQLMMGVCVIFSSVVFNSLWAITVRWGGDYIPLGVKQFGAALIPFTYAAAAVHFISAPGFENGKIMPKNWQLLVASLFVAGMMAGISIGLMLSGVLRD